MTRRPARFFALVLASVLTLGACGSDGEVTIDVNDDGNDSSIEAAGFVDGLVDGFIAPFTGIASLFDNDVTVYEGDNEGSGYTLGFVIGLVLIILLLLGLLTGGRRYYTRTA